MSIVSASLRRSVFCPFVHAAADNVRGAWSPPFTWPLIAAHAVLTPDGRVLTYGTDGDGKQTGYFIYDVWDPQRRNRPAGHLTMPNITGTDIFCSSQVIMPQSGNIFIAGGDNWTSTARPPTPATTTATSSARRPIRSTRGNNMNRPRWYSTSTTLLNGEIYIQGGNGGGDLPEIRDTDGRIAAAVEREHRRLCRHVSAQFPRAGRTHLRLRQQRQDVLRHAGRRGLADARRPVARRHELDLECRDVPAGTHHPDGRRVECRAGHRHQRRAAGRRHRRSRCRRSANGCRATVLPDGKVLGTGGSAGREPAHGRQQQRRDLEPRHGHLDAGRLGAPMRACITRSALLLPDATVLVAGGGAPGPLVNLNAEIYYPPYLFDATGARAARPEIISAPDTVDAWRDFPGRRFGRGQRQPRLFHQDRLDHAQRQHGSALLAAAVHGEWRTCSTRSCPRAPATCRRATTCCSCSTRRGCRRCRAWCASASRRRADHPVLPISRRRRAARAAALHARLRSRRGRSSA